MHLCLSCNQPCNISAIFCETCRLSLLERSTEEQQEPLAESSAASGGGEELVDLASHPRMEAAESVPLRMTEGGRLRFWQGSGAQTIETVESVEAKAEEEVVVAASAQATNPLLVATPPARRRMPTGVRRALWVFCIVGVLALTVDGVLLALSIMRHHAGARGMTPAVTIATSTSGTTPGAARSPSTPTQTAFALSSTRLLFTAALGQADPQPQTVTLFSGEQKAFTWDVTPTSVQPSWLHLSAAHGNAAPGTSAQIVVSVLTSHIAPGTYPASLLVKAFNEQGQALPASPQTLTVLLTVQTPCSLSVTPVKLSFAAVLLSPPTPQTLNISTSGDCAQPVNWQVSADVPWITFSSSSGSDTGSGNTITVQASSSGKLIGTYNARITLVATDARGAPLVNSPVTITATLTVLA